MPNVSPNIKGRGRGGGLKGKSKLAANKSAIKRASDSKGLECNFCSHGSEEEKVFGKLHSLENVSAHYNCLLFSSGLGQNGEEEEGIEGFFLDDIKKEIRRSTKLKCCYCRQNGASIGCLERRCKRSYHFLCGLNAFALFQFTGNFCSYCVDHRPFQEGVNRGQQVECPICMEELTADPKIAVWAACCKKDDWFHKECVQNMANSAGYFFKCPLCNDKDTFTESMQLSGIHVPEKDAVWESEPNAFSDLYERRIHCDAPVCKCPEGRKQDDLGTRWEILLCDLCGTTGVHIVCGKLPFTCTKWNCSSCIDMLEESSKRSKDEVRQRRLNERKERTAKDKGNNRCVGRLSLNATISESNPSHTNASSITSRGRGSRGRGRQSLNATIAEIGPSRTVITSPHTQRGRGKRQVGVRHSLTPSTQGRDKGKRKTGSKQSINVNADNSPSRTVITLPSTPKRRRTSEPLVLPRKIARLENTPIKELKRALLTPNKEPVVELERIKITHISVALDVEVNVEVEDKASGVSRSLTKLMECENTTASSDIKCKEINSLGANKSDNSELNCDIIPSDNLEISDLVFKTVIKGKDVDENENSNMSLVDENKNSGISLVDENKNSSISLVDENENSDISVSKKIVPDINDEKNEGLSTVISTDDNIRSMEDNGVELSESAIELKNFALTAQGIMNELQLTETEILKMASNRITKESLAKSDISRFFRYNLTIKKMIEIRNLLESVFRERKAIIKSAQESSRKKTKQVSPKIKKDDSLAYTPPKENAIITELRNHHSSDNIDVIPSVSAKTPGSPVKNSNKIKSSVGTLEESEKKTSEKTPTESPKKVDKLVIKMRSSPRKHLKTPPAKILLSETGEPNLITTTKTPPITTTTPEETGNIKNSIVDASIPNGQSTNDKPTTPSPRNSFGSPSLLGSPRKVPKSRIASPEKIAQGCILMWDEDLDEITDIPSKNEDDLHKCLADNSSIVDNTHEEEQILDSVDDPSSEIDNASSDTRIQCIEKLDPISNQKFTAANESIPDREIEGNLDILNSLNESDKLMTSPSINSVNGDNAHQKEQNYGSTESPTSETISNILTDPSMQCIEQLDTLDKQNSTATLENLEKTEKSTSAIPYNRDTFIDQSERISQHGITQLSQAGVQSSSSHIATSMSDPNMMTIIQDLQAQVAELTAVNKPDLSIDGPAIGRSTALNETQCNSNKPNKKGSLKSLRVVQPESKLRILRFIK